MMCTESSRTTHGSKIAVDACRYFAALLMGIFRGASKEELLSERYVPPSVSKDYWTLLPLCPGTLQFLMKWTSVN
jgi:ADP-ribosyl-[dinitrogen reductase] hydrolase